MITDAVSYHVKVIYGVLTGNHLDVQGQRHTTNHSVITDHCFQVDNKVKIL